MTYYNITVDLVVDAETLEEAQLKATLFMPWTTSGSDWHLTGHKYLQQPWKIDQWAIRDVDSDDMDGLLRQLGYR